MVWFSKNPDKNKQPADEIKYYNQETQRLFDYHQRTRHTYQSVHYNSHYLDWDNQPNPFRIFEGVPVIPLPQKPDFPQTGTFDVLSGKTGIKSSSDKLNLNHLSQLLYYSMAISAWKQVRGTEFKYSLRVNPSSGNLHPTETHLAVKGIDGLADGLYHYRVNEHALEQRGVGDYVAPLALLGNNPGAKETHILVILTSIFWRESWKYQSRAYRYCNHDLGHAIGSILTAANALNLPGYCIGHFPDELVAQVMGILESDEHPMVMIPLGMLPNEKIDIEKISIPEILEKVPPVAGIPNTLSQEPVDYPVLENMYIATLLPPEITPCPKVIRNMSNSPGELQLLKMVSNDKPLKIVSRTRRSALDFNPEVSMSFEDFSSLMYHATRGFKTDYQNGEGLNFITLYLYIHRVEGITPGVYRYEPESHSLAIIKEGDQKAWAAGLSLGQSIASNCVVAFSMIGDLKLTAEIFGNRGYRYVHYEAGYIGQMLYLGSEALGFNSTGIGAFFDEDVHKYLNISPEQGQVVYHFSVGKAVLDDRLMEVEG